MIVFLQLLVGAMTLGAMYALVAFGWGIVLNVTGVLNVAHGELVVIAALLTAVLVDSGITLPVTLALVTVLSIVLGLLVETLSVGRKPGSRNHINTVLITLGLALVLAEGAEIVFGSDPLIADPLLTGSPVDLGGVTIPLRNLPVVLVAFVVFLGIRWLNRAPTGRLMRACANSQEGARYCGIDTKRVSRIAFGVAGALAGITGFTFISFTPLAASSGLGLGLKGFVALVLAREDRTEAALAGGLVLAVIEVMVAGYISSRYQEAVAYVVLLIVLLARAARAGHVPRLRLMPVKGGQSTRTRSAA